MRAVHLEVTKTQTAVEFQTRLNAFITRRTRPQRIVSDNAVSFQNHSSVDKKDTTKRETAEFPRQTADNVAIQFVKVSLVGRNV